jgi:serine-type D-Ala-D-Ala carboxypeptidase/endopeptidase
MKPFILVLVTLLLSAHASAVEQHTFTNDEVKAIQELVDKHVGPTNSAFVVGLVDTAGSKVLTAGKLDNGTDKLLDGDSVFFIGSLSKTFTALLLLDMVERGEVKLDDPVAKYLPSSVSVPSFNGRQITLLDLATHASALPVDPDNMVGDDIRAKYQAYTVENLDEYLSTAKLTYEPGKEFAYSNLGMALLGEAMERKTGKSFESLIVERICRPLGMTSTGTMMTPEFRSRLAMGHDEAGNPALPFNLQAYQPAGGILSTANDLLKYAAAQAGLAQTKLSPSIQQSHILRYTDTHGLPGVTGPTFGRTAMDWVDRDAVQPAGMDLLGHAGGAGSYHSWLGFDQKQQRGVVALTTANDIRPESIGWTILQRMPLNEANAQEFARQLVGIGAALDIDKTTRILRIMKVLENSPALEANLGAGQFIQKVDDVPTAGKSLEECVKLIRGPVGTKVRLEIHDPTSDDTRSVELTRSKIVTVTS